jgi:hypothetical protein
MMAFHTRHRRIYRDGEPFVAVGVNYHPTAAGCRIWTEFDREAIRADFASIRRAGLNTVRFFLFWRDFEPAPGRYDHTVFTRLRETVDLAAAADLVCVISLFTIWMNGQRLDLPWRAGRDLWRDHDMLAIQEAFADRVASTLRGAENILAFDLGDEIANVEPAAAAGLSGDDVMAWQWRMATVLRRWLPGALVVQANDVSGVLGASPFGVDNSAALDLLATHGFPTWSPGSIESTTSYKATNLVPFLVRFALAYGTPLVDEFGSYGVSEATAAAYLRAAGASALANGAAGLAVWCWQDIASTAEPYQQRPGERGAGLRHVDGTAKPALAELSRLAEATIELVPTPPPTASSQSDRAAVAVYVPERERHAGMSYLDSGPGTVATFYAYLLLKRAHLDVDIVAGPVDGYRLIVCPSVGHLTLTDLDRLRAGLERGATVYYSLGDHLHGFPGHEFAGVELVDFSPPEGKADLDWNGVRWPLRWPPGTTRPVTVTASHGTSVAHFTDGTPAVQLHQVGSGQVIFCAAALERQLDHPGSLDERPWHQLYRGIAELAGVVPTIDCPDPDVEIVPDRRPGAPRAAVIHHGTGECRTTLTWDAGTTAEVAVSLTLGPHDWCVVRRPYGAAHHTTTGNDQFTQLAGGLR